MDEEKLKSHQRINDILLGPLERPALAWMARKMPAWVTPDILTGLGLFASVLICISFWLTTYNKNYLWLVSFGILLNWFGDSLDGTLARYRQIERPRFGFFVDHTTDAFNEVMIFVGLGLTPYISFPAACLALIGYLLVSVLVYVRTCVVGEFQISYSKLGPTEIRVLAILLNIVMYFWGIQTMTLRLGIFGEISFSPYDLALVLVAVILLYFFMATAIQETIRLAKVNE